MYKGKIRGDNIGNNSKYKTRKILEATTTVTMLTTGIISSSNIFAEETKQQKKISTSLQEGKVS